MRSRVLTLGWSGMRFLSRWKAPFGVRSSRGGSSRPWVRGLCSAPIAALGIALAVALAATPAWADCPELLQNNEFSSSSIPPWRVNIDSPAVGASLRVSSDSYKTLNLLTGSSPAGSKFELVQTVAVESGQRYRLSFYMYGVETVLARAVIRNADTPTTTYGLDQSFQVSTKNSDATSAFTFVATATDPAAELALLFPSYDAYSFFAFDSLFLSQISSPQCPVTGVGGMGGGAGASGSGGAGGKGGAPGSGGAPGTGGAPGSGGAPRSGGAAGGASSGGGAGGTGGLGTTGTGGAAGGSSGGTGGLTTPSTGGTNGTGAAGTGTGGIGGSTPDGGVDAVAADASGPRTCTPGDTVICTCAGGHAGVQTCSAQGEGYGACSACLDAGTTPGPSSKSGCGCDVAPDAPTWSWLAALAALTLAARRAQERKRR